MPVIELVCDKCGEVVEIITSFESVPEMGSTVKSEKGVVDKCKCGSDSFKRPPSTQARMASWSNW